jgi:hypothetical protein
MALGGFEAQPPKLQEWRTPYTSLASWSCVPLVLDHFLHFLLLVASLLGLDGGRGFLLMLVVGLP